MGEDVEEEMDVYWRTTSKPADDTGSWRWRRWQSAGEDASQYTRTMRKQSGDTGPHPPRRSPPRAT